MGPRPIPWGAFVALGVLSGAGCNVLLGYDEGQLGGAPTTSSGIAGGGGTGGASPTGAGTAGGGGAGTSSGGSGGEAGAMPTTCDLWPSMTSPACADGYKCSVVNESTGDTACVPAGPQPAWARCISDSACQDRLWCDHGTAVCKPVCQTANHCPAGAGCLNASADAGGVIPSLQVCTAHCDPRNPTSCSQSNGTTNCLYGSAGFDCFATGDDGYPSLCSFLDCGPPHTCANGSCRLWCDDQGHPCPPLVANCYSYPSPIYYDGVELGFCSGL